MSGVLIGYAHCSTDAQALIAQRERLAELGLAEDCGSLDHGLTSTNHITNRMRPGLTKRLRRSGRHARDAEARSAYPFRARRSIGTTWLPATSGCLLADRSTIPPTPMARMFFNILATFAEFFAADTHPRGHGRRSSQRQAPRPPAEAAAQAAD
jgi:hypothetical protein